MQFLVLPKSQLQKIQLLLIEMSFFKSNEDDPRGFMECKKSCMSENIFQAIHTNISFRKVCDLGKGVFGCLGSVNL